MNLKNASILVIDDDQDVLTAVRLLLKTEVKNVVTEKNPQNLRWLLKDAYDVILLDMNFRVCTLLRIAEKNIYAIFTLF